MTKKQSDWKMTTIRLPISVMSKIKLYCEIHECSQSALIRRILDEGLNNRGITNEFLKSHEEDLSKK